MTNKELIYDLIEDNKKLRYENKLLSDKLKKCLTKSSDLMVKYIKLKGKIDFYESLNFSSDDEYAKGFNKAFKIIQDLINSNKED